MSITHSNFHVVLNMYTVLNFQGCQDLLEFAENDVNMADLDDSNWIDEDELDPTLAAAPPGEEGFFISYAGGEASLQGLFIDEREKVVTKAGFFPCIQAS